MSAITTSIDVDRPAEQVFAYATDPARFPEWQRGVVEGHMDGDGDPSVGARCLTTRRIGFRDRPITSEVTHVDPPHKWGIRSIEGPIRAAVDLTVEPLAANRSRLTIALDFSGHGLGQLLVPLVVRREARRKMPSNLAALKQRVEGGDQARRPDGGHGRAVRS